MSSDGSGGGHTRKGSWIEEKMIGSGGFGAVVLWRNEDTGEQLALKKCRLQNEMTAKHKQRWKLEVDIMQRLEHDSVISARKVPSELDVHPNDLPLLAMEYCSGGDLRKVMNRPENCCGLSEFTIRGIVKDITSAVEYLHGKRIIHRDLKPENIVIAEEENRVTYKLIDLGYAKELDQGSVCTSFVGTLQYLAPELFASQKYTCTVDYWSFGTVVFECVTGYRPFLPNIPPVQWHREVCKKSPEDICSFHDNHGDVKFSKTFPTPTNLCRSMQTYFEQWLRLMLRWDPKARGGGLGRDNSRPNCFIMSDNILSMKIIYLLHVSTNQLLTYPVIEQHTMNYLQKKVEDETNIAVEEQDILLGTGMSPHPDKHATQCWLEPSEDDCLVFLFKRGGVDFSPNAASKSLKPIPKIVQSIVREPDIKLPFQEQKKTWAEAVHYCVEVDRDFKRIILSERAAMLSLLRTDSNFVKMKSKMLNDSDRLIAKIEYFRQSLELDLQQYIEQAQTGGVSSDRMFTTWQKHGEEVNKYLQLREQVSQLEQQSVALQTKIVELQRSPFARVKKDELLEDCAKRAKQQYQELRQSSRENREVLQGHRPMVNLIVKCVMHREKKMQDLFAHLGKIGSCKEEIRQLMPRLEKCCMDIEDACNQLLNYQQTRQTNIWRLVRVALTQSGSLKSSGFSSSVINQHVRSDSQSSNYSNPALTSMANDTSMESLRVMEENKTHCKRFDDMLNSMIEEHEELTSIISSLDLTAPT